MAADDTFPGLATDLYELTMAQAYLHEGMTDTAVFDLFVRRLPASRNCLLACGLDDAMHCLETMRFSDAELAYLETLDRFRPDFLDWLSRFRFSGDVVAVAEGTPVFPNEPLLEVSGPLPEVQIVETMMINLVHLQTVIAAKALRVVQAAQGRPVVDFGMRRYYGLEASLKAARAFHVAGVQSTSNVLAGRDYGLPVSGTMAHSYIQAHDDEYAAFRDFAGQYPATTLLVDTYDTLEGIRHVIRLARELGDAFHVQAVRLDSGDLGALARESRRMLDAAGLPQVRIIASGGLDEVAIADLVASGAPIDAFGVGTAMGVPKDAPSLDIAYKLVSYAGRGRLKLSPGKATLPGPKQVFRRLVDGKAQGDMIALQGETMAGEPLLQPVMRQGVRLPAGKIPLPDIRSHAQWAIGTLPPDLLLTTPARTPYPVTLSPGLQDELRRLQGDHRHAA